MSKTASPSQKPFACVPEQEVSVGEHALVACASLSGWPLGMPVKVYAPAVTCLTLVAEPSRVYLKAESTMVTITAKVVAEHSAGGGAEGGGAEGDGGAWQMQDMSE